MESKVIAIDASVNSQRIKNLKRRVKEQNNTILRFKNVTIGLVLLMVILVGVCFIQHHQISKMGNEINELNTKYEDMRSSYVEMSIQYAQVKTKLEQQNPKVDTNSIEVEQKSTEPKQISSTETISSSSVQYSLPGFKYNESITLSEDLQRYAYQKCKEYNIEYPILLGLMRKESTFNPSAKSSTGDYGLCQINQCNHNWMREVFGSDWDPMNPYDSIDASVYILDHYSRTYNCDNYHVLLMNYNMGHNNAVECFNSGIYSSKYSRAIMSYAKEYGYSGDDKLIY